MYTKQERIDAIMFKAKHSKKGDYRVYSELKLELMDICESATELEYNCKKLAEVLKV